MPFGPKQFQSLTSSCIRGVKPIPGCPGYFINRKGEVFSIRKLGLVRDDDGYLRPPMYIGGKVKRPGVHILLARTFLQPPRPEQTEVRHLDGDPTNNSIGNLAWGTRAENAADMARHGTVKGERNPRARLTRAQVRAIVKGWLVGRKNEYQAKKYGVSVGTIKAILEGRNWNHVTKIR